jgi:hypothetical protein
MDRTLTRDHAANVGALEGARGKKGNGTRVTGQEPPTSITPQSRKR